MSCREGCSVISGILAGGIPGFRIELCCFLHPPKWPIVILWLIFLLFNFMGLRPHGTQVVICMRRDDIKLSPLASIDLFHHKLELSRHCLVVCVGVCFLCVWVFVLVFCCFVSWCVVLCLFVFQ